MFPAVLRWTAEPAGSLSLGSSGEPQKKRLLLLTKSAGGNFLNSGSCKKVGPGCICCFLSYILPPPLSCHCSGYLRGPIRALLRKGETLKHAHRKCETGDMKLQLSAGRGILKVKGILLSCRKKILFTHKPCVMSWSVPSFLAAWGQTKVPCSTMSTLPKCPSLLPTAFPRCVQELCWAGGTVLPLISALTAKTRDARNGVSQLCQWLSGNRWSSCQFFAAALLISHFRVFCALVKGRTELFFGWVTTVAEGFFFLLQIFFFTQFQSRVENSL